MTQPNSTAHRIDVGGGSTAQVRASAGLCPEATHRPLQPSSTARGDMTTPHSGASINPQPNGTALHDRLPEDAPNRWVDPSCRWCKPAAPCLMHDRRPKTLAQNRVIFGPSFGYEPTPTDHAEAGL